MYKRQFQHLVNEIVLLDVNPAAAAAQAGDLNDLASGLGDNFVIRVGDYSDCKDAHFVILTAGQMCIRDRLFSS